jgi:hypothetical protein
MKFKAIVSRKVIEIYNIEAKNKAEAKKVFEDRELNDSPDDEETEEKEYDIIGVEV